VTNTFLCGHTVHTQRTDSWDAVSELAPKDSVLLLDVLELSGEIMAEHCLELSNEGKC